MENLNFAANESAPRNLYDVERAALDLFLYCCALNGFEAEIKIEKPFKANKKIGREAGITHDFYTVLTYDPNDFFDADEMNAMYKSIFDNADKINVSLAKLLSMYDQEPPAGDPALPDQL